MICPHGYPLSCAGGRAGRVCLSALSAVLLSGCQVASPTLPVAPQEHATIVTSQPAAIHQEAALAKLDAIAALLAELRVNIRDVGTITAKAFSDMTARFDVQSTATADLRNEVRAATTQNAGHDASSGGYVGRDITISLGQTAGTGLAGAAGVAGLGLLGMKLRRAQRHSWSLVKAIRAAEDSAESTDEIAGVKLVMDRIEKITRADETAADNERLVKRLKPRT